jgi:hypothetical protein
LLRLNSPENSKKSTYLSRGELSLEPSCSLCSADLSDADLRGTPGLLDTEEQITAAKSLKGTTIPNGQKYKDQLKDR